MYNSAQYNTVVYNGLAKNAYERLASVAIGIASSASRAIVITRTKATDIGIAAAASRIFGSVNKAAVQFGVVTGYAALDIGDAATDRDTTKAAGTTYLNIGNPSESDGIVTDVEIWTNTELTGCKVGTFYEA